MPTIETLAPDAIARDDAQDHEAEDIVDHRRADDDPGLLAGHSSKIREHPGRNPDGGRGERGADEDGLGDAVARARSSRREGGAPSRRSRARRARSRRRSRPPVRRGRRGTSRAGRSRGRSRKAASTTPSSASTWTTSAAGPCGGHDSQNPAAEDDAGDELPQHGGLPNPLGQLAEQLGPDEHRRDREKQPRDVRAAFRGKQWEYEQDGEGCRPRRHDVRAALPPSA